jgi:hypothetical protein
MSGHSGSEGKHKHHFRSNQSKIMLFYTILASKCLWYFVEKGMIVKHFHEYFCTKNPDQNPENPQNYLRKCLFIAKPNHTKTNP